MKRTLSLLLLLCLCSSFAHSQTDSIFYYNPDGTKSWWYLQPNVIIFRCQNDTILSQALDSTLVDGLVYWADEYRQLNEVLINSSATIDDLLALYDSIQLSPEFAIFAPALTQYPYLGYEQNKYMRTDDQVLVTFNDPDVPDSILNGFMQEYKLELVHRPLDGLDTTLSWGYIFKIRPAQHEILNSILIANLIVESEPDLVKIAQPNMYSEDFLSCISVNEMSPIVASSTNTLASWYLNNPGGVIFGGESGVADADADICECWGEGYDGTGIKVGVIDIGGFEYNHPDLANVQSGFKLNEQPAALFIGNTYTNPAIGHGMLVAGIIGATVNNRIGTQEIAAGAAHGALIYPYLLGSINAADVLKGVQRASVDSVDIVNMSFKLAPNAILEDNINNTILSGRNGKGMIFVAATGNDDLMAPHFPASIENVIGVGSSSPEDYRTSYSGPGNSWSTNPANGSTYGPPSYHFDVVAPGEIMASTDLLGDNGTPGNYAITSGTSFSSPLVASIAAMLLQKNPNLTFLEVRDLIRNGAEKVRTSTYNYNSYSFAPGYNDEMFYGRVSCINSLSNVVGLEENVELKKLFVYRKDENIFGLFLPASGGDQQVQVINTLGQTLMTQIVSRDQHEINLDFTNFSNGLYVIYLTGASGTIGSAKIIK